MVRSASAFILTFIFAFNCFAADLKIVISEVRNDVGEILVSLFKSGEGYPSEASRAVRTARIKAASGKVEYSFENLEPGDYALAFMHDENGNGKVDMNFVGMPKEGFGFSNDPRIYFGPPSYNKARFELQAPSASLSLKTKYY